MRKADTEDPTISIPRVAAYERALQLDQAYFSIQCFQVLCVVMAVVALFTTDYKHMAQEPLQYGAMAWLGSVLRRLITLRLQSILDFEEFWQKDD